MLIMIFTIRRINIIIDSCISNGVNDEEYWIGMYCMAVPVRNYTGKIVAAVSASIPVFRVDDKKKEFVLDELNRTAGQISKELGYLG